MTYSGDSTGYTDALFKANAANLLKKFTISEINIPITGTNSSVGISAISSIFIGMDFLNNLQNENAGRAFAHTAVTTAVTAVGIDVATTALLATATGSGTAAAVATFLASNPVGWTIVAGVAVGYAVGYAYNHNFLGIKTIANEMGDNLDKSIKEIGSNIDSGIKEVGNSIDSGIKSIQKVFGW